MSRQSTEEREYPLLVAIFEVRDVNILSFLKAGPLLPAVWLFCREYGGKQRSENKGDEGRECSDLTDFIQTIKEIQLKYLLL